MLEIAVLSLFSMVLLLCITQGYTIVLALALGYILFCAYGLMRRFTLPQLLEMSRKGVKTVRNILTIFLFIGMLTALWRACGTIPFIVYHVSGLIAPSAVALVAFLLCCFISILTGTAFGAAATVGVICMTFASTMGIDPALMGGAVLSGIFFGDRCSPMSSSALLVSELTGTDIYRNVKNMVRTSIVPFVATCALYLFLGAGPKDLGTALDIRALLAAGFDLHWIVVLPAGLVVVLCALRVNVKLSMAASILTACAICLLAQDTGAGQLAAWMITGFKSAQPALANMVDGGGIISMARPAAIVCISSSYAGIFEGTGLLTEIKGYISRLSEKVTATGSILLTSMITGMIACNQTLSIILTYHLCKDMVPDSEGLAIDLENTAVIISPLIPWSVAGAVPIAAIAAPGSCLLMAFYLYLLPLWHLLSSLVRRKSRPTAL